MSVWWNRNQQRFVRPAWGSRGLLLSLALVLVSVAALGAQSLQELDAFIARVQQEWPVPGLAVAIVKDGETVLAKGYGVREKGLDAPVDEHTLFAIASNTKAFTAAALAMRWRKGS